jgi:predicted dehydrogenase/nucleoside-diphosphate-sugar epimerase
MSKTLRVALFGGGKMGLEHAKAIRSCRHSRLVAVADSVVPCAELKERFGSDLDVFSDPVELVATVKPDLVHVVTPPGTHAELAQVALSGGANVYVEKPFALSTDDAERVLRMAESRGLRVCAAHQILFQDAGRSYRQNLSEFGEIVHVESFFSFRPVRGRKSGLRIGPAAEQLVDILPHPVYLMLDALRAGTTAAAEMIAIEASLDGEVRAIIRAGGILGSLIVSLRARPVESWLRVMGTNGMIEADFVLGNVIRHPGPGVSAPAIIFKPFSRACQMAWGSALALIKLAIRRHSSYPGLAELVEQFHYSVLTQAEPPLSAAEILDTVRLCELIAVRLRDLSETAEAQAEVSLRNQEAHLPPHNNRGIVLLTGGTGTLGRSVARELRLRGWRVRVPVRRRVGPAERIAGIEYVPCDLADHVSDSTLEGVESVLHLAAETAGSKPDHERNTIKATRNLLESMARCGIRRMINVSSVAVLKPSRFGGSLNESSPVDYDNPDRGPYVWAKAEAERFANEFGKSADIDVRTVRLGPLVDYDQFAAPGRLGREVSRLFVAMGRPSSRLSVCQISTATGMLCHAIAGFESLPRVCNLLEHPPPTRGDLVQRLRQVRPDLKFVWMPFWLLRPLSALFGLLSKALRPNSPALDVYSAFRSETYDGPTAEQLQAIRR